MARLSRRTFLKASAATAFVGCASREDEDLPPEDGKPPSPPGTSDERPPGEEGPPPREEPGMVDPGRPPTDFTPLKESDKDFPLGIMAGDTTAGAAILWAHYPGERKLGLIVVEMDMDGDTGVRTVFDQEVARGPDGFTHVEVTGLRPGARHEYAFVLRDGPSIVARSPVGRFRTALGPDDLLPVTFGGTSCTHQYDTSHDTLARAAMRKDLDFFLHGGDHVYCDHEEAVSLAEYRGKYRQGWSTPGMKALHRSAGMYLTWDDHEVDNNWNPEKFSASRLKNARQAFFEHRAIRRHPTSPSRIWRSFRWGKTVEVFVLDVRSERKPSTRDSANAQYISPAQLEWLKNGLAASPAMFKVILNSVPIIDFPGAPPSTKDRWDAYAAQRKNLLDFIAESKIPGIWWASGDHHYGAIGKLAASGPASSMREVLMGPGGTNANKTITLDPPQFDCALKGEKNFTVFKADPVARAMTVSFFNATGKKLFEKTYPM